ncbi:MAG: hypothetical protein JXJ04_12520, partial [Spirochaetales bacterium]|nr:hypothetical protein [Spirochaetales bacterium]
FLNTLTIPELILDTDVKFDVLSRMGCNPRIPTLPRQYLLNRYIISLHLNRLIFAPCRKKSSLVFSHFFKRVTSF